LDDCPFHKCYAVSELSRIILKAEGTSLVKNSTVYQIRVQGHLEDEWSDWFDGMNITHLENSETLLAGPVADQSALFGLLIKINSLNLTLLSVQNVELDSGSS
jgi:hypothetical protein